MDNYVYTITTKVAEDYDNFVFETIRPFCEEITQMKIEKAQLSNALIKSIPQKILVVNGEECCPSCKSVLSSDIKGMMNCFCKWCGQHISRRW